MSRLVACAFLAKPQNFTKWWLVAHADGDKANNNASNLRWQSRSQVKCAAARSLASASRTAVWRLDADSHEQLAIYRSQTVAAQYIGVSLSSIAGCLAGRS